MKIRTTLATLLLGCVAASAFAQTPAAGAASTPRVDQRQERQEARINQGAASGALTAREQRRLHGEQKAINRAETNAKADGTVTAKERARLHHMENKASRDIRRQKHDAQRAAKPASAP